MIMEIQRVKQQFDIIGNSPLLNRGIEIAMQVAITELSVLITGESGVGKEHFPKIIHHHSPRKHAPYFAINCGAIPEGTIDAELFGHTKGAFTDAKSERKGYFEIADGGTLFLDEVGELPLSTQARLLRVLESGEFIRVGSSQVQKTNVRVVAATNLDIPRAIKEGKFREDLYYRLNEVGIRIPALRERKEDIPLLFRKFARDFAERYQMPAISLTPDAVELIKRYYWRGNIRQLKNTVNKISVIERRRDITPDILSEYLPDNEQYTGIVTYGRGQQNSYQNSDEIEVLKQIVYRLSKELEHLKQQIQVSSNPTPIDVPILEPTPIVSCSNKTYKPRTEEGVAIDITNDRKQKSTPTAPATLPIKTKAEREKEAILEALHNSEGNRKVAAQILGMSERTLYRKLNKMTEEGTIV
jgi:DNA-binding NtrC family response regulator